MPRKEGFLAWKARGDLLPYERRILGYAETALRMLARHGKAIAESSILWALERLGATVSDWECARWLLVRGGLVARVGSTIGATDRGIRLGSRRPRRGRAQ